MEREAGDGCIIGAHNTFYFSLFLGGHGMMK